MHTSFKILPIKTKPRCTLFSSLGVSQSNTTDTTRGAGTAYTAIAHDFIPGF